MKKLNLIIIITIIFSTIFYSCDNQIKNIDNKDNIELFKNLSDFNDSQIFVDTKEKKCSGFWDCLGYVSQVAGADIIGAGTGVVAVAQAAAYISGATGGTGAGASAALLIGSGVVCGAGASYAAASIVDPVYINDNIKYGNLKIEIPNQYKYLSNIGKEHNSVIHNNFYYNQDIEIYYKNKLNSKDINIIKSNLMNNNLELVKSLSVEYVNNDYDYKTFTSELVENKIYSKDMKTVMDLFLKNYFKSVNFNDMENVINFYINEISNSNLKEIEKTALISSCIVASESPFYLLK